MEEVVSEGHPAVALVTVEAALEAVVEPQGVALAVVEVALEAVVVALAAVEVPPEDASEIEFSPTKLPRKRCAPFFPQSHLNKEMSRHYKKQS